MKKQIFLLLFGLNTILFGSLGGFLPKENLNAQNEPVTVYKDMLAYLEVVGKDDSKQLIVLGSLYAAGTNIPDSTGAIIEQDIFKAEKYLLKSANMGNPRALTILSGFILTNNNMRKLDPNLEKTEKYLNKAFQKDLPAGTLLANLYFEKGFFDKAIDKLFETASLGDSSAEFALALLLKQGLTIEDKTYIKKDDKLAEMYLNKACLNKFKNQKLKDICSNSDMVQQTIN